MAARTDHDAATVGDRISDAGFRRIVCGIDGSPEAQEAAREASLLAVDGAHLFLIDVLVPGMVGSLATAIPGGTTTPNDAARAAARAELERAQTAVRPAVEHTATVEVGGPAAAILRAEAARLSADTLAVGSHGQGRALGMLLGSVATLLLHDAPCSVLVARAAPTRSFPKSVVVGLDGSEPAYQALRSARELARRIGVPLRVLHVLDGRLRRGVLQAGPDEEVEEVRASWSAPEGLATHVTAADLLVVGSRGMRGVRALGSVSEAVAHQAPSSVLVVR